MGVFTKPEASVNFVIFKKQTNKTKQNKTRNCGSGLTRSLYSQNIQRRPPLGGMPRSVLEVCLFCYKPIRTCKWSTLICQ